VTIEAQEDAAKAAQAKRAILRVVAEGPRPARELVQTLVNREPAIGVDRIRAAMWELVGSGRLSLSWEGMLAAGANKRQAARSR
jgi:hypothetical protein